MTSDSHSTGTHSEAPARRLPRPLLWVLLIVALAANGGASLLALLLAVGAILGVLVLALAALLVRDHYQRRTRP